MLSELSPNLFSGMVNNKPYHLLLLLFLHIALLGNFFHKYSKSSLYFSFIYLIILWACLVLNILGIVHLSIISFRILSYSSFIWPINLPFVFFTWASIYSSLVDKSITFDVWLWLDISTIISKLSSLIFLV